MDVYTEPAPLGFKNADQLKMEDEERRKLENAPPAPEVVVDRLASYVRKCWQAAKEAKEARILERERKCLRQRKGEYDPDIKEAIEERGGTPIFMMLTDEKCTALESWLEDLLMPVDDQPFGVESTKKPDVKPEKVELIHQKVMAEVEALLQEEGRTLTPDEIFERESEIFQQIQAKIIDKAKKQAEQAQKELGDILEEADWRETFKAFIYYFSTFPTAYLKGPVLRSKPKLVWGEDGPTVEDEVVMEFDAPSPFDIYPSPNSRGINDGYLIERHTLTRSDLYSLIGTDTGYDDEAIKQVLSEAQGNSLASWTSVDDSSRDLLEGRERKELDPEGRIEALQYWGSVSSEKLLEWGFSDDEVELEPGREYEAEVWLINTIVIKAMLNSDPLGNKPYYKASFRELYGQFHGMSLPEIIRDCQMMCNSAARNLAENMALAAGPQVGVDVSAMPEQENYEDIYPRKVWPFDLSSGPSSAGGRQPIWFFNAPSLANELLGVYNHYSEEADTKSGIPRYSYGNRETGGPLSTATGFRMMMENAARGIKKVVRNIDQGVIRPMISYLFQWEMLYNEEFRSRYTGDIRIVARGSSALTTKDQRQMMLQEILFMTLKSEYLTNLIGQQGIAELYRELIKGTDIGVDNVVPTDEEIEARARREGEEAQRVNELNERMMMEKHQAEIEMMISQAASMSKKSQEGGSAGSA